MDEKKLENVQEIEDGQLDEVNGGSRLNARVMSRANAAASGACDETDAARARVRVVPNLQSIYAADEGQPVVVANPDMTIDKSIY